MLQYYARAYDEAIMELQRVIELQPDSDHAHSLLGRALLQKGDIARALEHFSSRSHASPGSFGDLQAAPMLQLGACRRHAQRSTDFISSGSQGFGVAYDLATIHASLNEIGPACDALTKALDDHSQMIGYLQVDPAIDKLRGEPCYADVHRRLYSFEG